MKYSYKLKREFKPNLYGEKNEEPSQTIQDDSLTIEQLLKKYSSGQLIASEDNYMDANLENDDVLSFHRPILDLTELDNLKYYHKELEDEIAWARKEKEKLEKLEKAKPIEPIEEPKEEE